MACCDQTHSGQANAQFIGPVVSRRWINQGEHVAEGYSHRSGKDQARFYEYPLGSARESRGWYHDARHILREPAAMHRIQLMTKIVRLLLTIIPSERGFKLKEKQETYLVDDRFLFGDLPVP